MTKENIEPKKKGFNLSSAPTEIAIQLNYPYLKGEGPRHYYPRIRHTQAREITSFVNAKGDGNDELLFRWWSDVILEKTRDEYEGLGMDWKRELWDHPEGRWHIIHSVQAYFRAISPSNDFLAE